MLGGSIEEEASLLVATEQMFRVVFKVDCRTNCEVVAIDAKQKTVDFKNRLNGEVTTESYDKLVLSPGAAPIRPPLDGIDLPGIFSVRTVADAVDMKKWLEKDVDRSVGNSIHRSWTPTLKAGAPWLSAADLSVSKWSRTWSSAVCR